MDEGRAVGVPERERGADGAAAPSTEAVVEAVEAAGAEARVDAPADLAGADLAAIVAPGEDALRSLAVEAPRAPLVPVSCDAGVHAVADGDLDAALAELLDDGALRTVRHDLLAVRAGGERVGTAFRDASLLAAEPAGISEFAVESAALGDVDDLRADGLVVATPAGSPGYAAAGDGPLLAPGTGVAVVPVAPFRVDRVHWVLPGEGVGVEVCRDETVVSLEVDGTVERTVGQHATVEFERAASVEVAVLDAGAPAFE